MINEDGYYIGHRVFYDTQANMKFTKIRYGIPLRNVVYIQDSSGAFIEEPESVHIVTLNGELHHVVAEFDNILERHIQALKMSNL